MKVLLVDNFDSFTHNLRHLILAACPTAELRILRNNDPRLFDESPDLLLISPGPRGPIDTGLLADLWAGHIVPRRIPVFGVCLGFQFIAHACGVPVVRSDAPVHGSRVSIVSCTADHPLLAGLPPVFAGARYNSLDIRSGACAGTDCIPLALEEGSDRVMIAAHRMLPVCGVQYHPESFMSEHGIAIVRNLVRVYVETA